MIPESEFFSVIVPFSPRGRTGGAVGQFDLAALATPGVRFASRAPGRSKGATLIGAVFSMR
jgi:hypothetical protein